MKQYYRTNYPTYGTKVYISRTKICTDGTKAARKEYNKTVPRKKLP